jgi:hypothetical protein
MTESLPQPATEGKETSNPPPPKANINPLDLMEWGFKYVFTPIIPFIIGATICLLEAGRWTLNALDPAELSFSLAMFCLFATVSARKLKESEFRETIAGLYTFGQSLR